MWVLLSSVLYFHQYSGRGSLVLVSFFCLCYCTFLWWRDVFREGRSGFHTTKVQSGLQLGMYLFIWSERMFFVGLLWSFLHRSLQPTIQLGMSWPPLGIVPVQWWGLPKVNTLLLLASYFTANRRKHRLEQNQKNTCSFHLMVTIA